ncbi:MAG: tRNA (guanosine(37)-N1)-methyltransferase TrmD [bacterium]
MKFEIITLFPDYFNQALKQSLIGKAVDKKLFEIRIVNLRDYATDRHNTVDDTPFGGGGGMVLKVEPLDLCLKDLGYSHKNKSGNTGGKIILTSAAGQTFKQTMAVKYSLGDRLTIICGHYLGVDQRITELYEIEEVSVGDYVLSGGEPAAMVMIDAIGRLVPGVLGNFESALEDSHMNQLLGSSCYTKPAEYEGLKVPEELMSGNHELIKQFRHREALRNCYLKRPDLLETAELTEEEDKELEKIKQAEKKNKF